MSSQINIAYYHSPVGELILGSHQNKLVLCDWRYRKMRAAIDKRIMDGLDANFDEEPTAITDLAVDELKAYFNKERVSFSVPLKFVGTDFQKTVWNELLNIPFGKTMTYLQLSRKLGDEKAIRAVATANGANAISIMVPCHRIIGSDGDLVGYAGGLPAKKKLLQLEGAISDAQLELFSS